MSAVRNRCAAIGGARSNRTIGVIGGITRSALSRAAASEGGGLVRGQHPEGVAPGCWVRPRDDVAVGQDGEQAQHRPLLHRGARWILFSVGVPCRGEQRLELVGDRPVLGGDEVVAYDEAPSVARVLALGIDFAVADVVEGELLQFLGVGPAGDSVGQVVLCGGPGF